MSGESAIFARLSMNAEVSNFVGSRIYPLLIPQADPKLYPAISYQRIAAEHVASLQGHSGLVNARVQVDCWALSYGAARGLAQAVKLAMTWQYDNKFSALVATDLDDYEPDTRLYRVSMDFSVWQTDEV